LPEREKEVVTIRMSLFNEEQIMKSFIKSERHDEAKETAEKLMAIRPINEKPLFGKTVKQNLERV
jgi:hypothetical protein